jgi:hypothetical protein
MSFTFSTITGHVTKVFVRAAIGAVVVISIGSFAFTTRYTSKVLFLHWLSSPVLSRIVFVISAVFVAFA